MTELELVRNVFRNPECVIGALRFVDQPSDPFFVLERIAVMIPAGRYEVRLTHSPKFGVTMPILCEVPGRQGIRIHTGNLPKDTDGCLLVGNSWGNEGALAFSKAAYDRIFKLLEKSAGPRWLTIKDAP